MTDQELGKLMRLQHKMWEIAAPVGSMHAYWDTIMCLNMFIRGQPIMGHGEGYSAADWIAEAESTLRRDGHLAAQ